MTDPDPTDMDAIAERWNFSWPMAYWFRWLRGDWTDEDKQAVAEVRYAVGLMMDNHVAEAANLLNRSTVPPYVHTLAVVFLAAGVVVFDGRRCEGKLVALVRADADRDAQWQDNGEPDSALIRVATREFTELTGALASTAHGGPHSDTTPLMEVIHSVIHGTGTPYTAHLKAGLLVLGCLWRTPAHLLDAGLLEMIDNDVAGTA